MSVRASAFHFLRYSESKRGLFLHAYVCGTKPKLLRSLYKPSARHSGRRQLHLQSRIRALWAFLRLLKGGSVCNVDILFCHDSKLGARIVFPKAIPYSVPCRPIVSASVSLIPIHGAQRIESECSGSLSRSRIRLLFR